MATLLEAQGLITASTPKILCVLADLPIPSLYRDYLSSPTDSYALALVISAEGGQQLSLTAKAEDTSNATATIAEPQALAFIRFLLDGQPEFHTQLNRCPWQISRV